ncbi:NAD(P)H-dependent oxidoreductase [Stutzerimonas stutzeri]|nr:NAD(P)H-dependent oxidoreductase [Stutzerimonas stutzeri]
MPLPQILIVSGSHSPDSQSARLAGYLRQRLQALEIADEVALHDLGSAPLPLWQEGVPYPFAAQAASAEALILISPEWHGMGHARVEELVPVHGPRLAGAQAGAAVRCVRWRRRALSGAGAAQLLVQEFPPLLPTRPPDRPRRAGGAAQRRSKPGGNPLPAAHRPYAAIAAGLHQRLRPYPPRPAGTGRGLPLRPVNPSTPRKRGLS